MSPSFSFSVSFSFKFGINIAPPPKDQVSEDRCHRNKQQTSNHIRRQRTTSQSPGPLHSVSGGVEDTAWSPANTAAFVNSGTRERMADLQSLRLLETATATKPGAGSCTNIEPGFAQLRSIITESSLKPRLSINMPDVEDPFAAGPGWRGKGSNLLSSTHCMQAKLLGELLATTDYLSETESTSSCQTAALSSVDDGATSKALAAEEVNVRTEREILEPTSVKRPTAHNDLGESVAKVEVTQDKSVQAACKTTESSQSDRFSAYTASDQTSDARSDVYASRNQEPASTTIERAHEWDNIDSEDGEIEKECSPSQRSNCKSDAASSQSLSIYLSLAQLTSPANVDLVYEQEGDFGDDWEEIENVHDSE